MFADPFPFQPVNKEEWDRPIVPHAPTLKNSNA